MSVDSEEIEKYKKLEKILLVKKDYKNNIVDKNYLDKIFGFNSLKEEMNIYKSRFDELNPAFIVYEKNKRLFGSEQKFISELQKFLAKYSDLTIPFFLNLEQFKNYYPDIRDYSAFFNFFREFIPENNKEEKVAGFLLDIAESVFEKEKIFNEGKMFVLDGKVFCPKNFYKVYRTVESVLPKNFDGSVDMISLIEEFSENFHRKRKTLSPIEDVKNVIMEKFLLKNKNKKHDFYNEILFYIFTEYVYNTIHISPSIYFRKDDLGINDPPAIKTFENDGYFTESKAKELFIGKMGFFYFQMKRFRKMIDFVKEKDIGDIEAVKSLSYELEPVSLFFDRDSEIYQTFNKMDFFGEEVFGKTVLSAETENGGREYVYYNKFYRNPASLALVLKETDRMPLFFIKRDVISNIIAKKNLPKKSETEYFSYDFLVEAFKLNPENVIKTLDENNFLINPCYFLKERNAYYRKFIKLLEDISVQKSKKMIFHFFQNLKRKDYAGTFLEEAVLSSLFLRESKFFSNTLFISHEQEKLGFVMDKILKESVFKNKTEKQISKKTLAKGIDFYKNLEVLFREGKKISFSGFLTGLTEDENKYKYKIIRDSFYEAPLESLITAYMLQETRFQKEISKKNLDKKDIE